MDVSLFPFWRFNVGHCNRARSWLRIAKQVGNDGILWPVEFSLLPIPILTRAGLIEYSSKQMRERRLQLVGRKVDFR